MIDSSADDNVLKGQASTGGVTIGYAIVQGEDRPKSDERYVAATSINFELEQLTKHRNAASSELQALILAARQMGGREIADIVTTQLEILHDPELNKELSRLIIEEKFTAEWAIEKVFRAYIARMEETGSEHMMERTADLRDIRDRLYRHLHFQTTRSAKIGNVLVAHEITPTELLEYSAHIKGAVMTRGGTTSHVAIIAASMGIPLVLGVRDLLKRVHNGDQLIVDADAGEVVINPTESQRRMARKKIKSLESRSLSHKSSVEPAVTRCGQRIVVRANVELEPELASLNDFRPEGIGLVRTESLVFWLGKDEAQKRQVDYYSAIVRAADGHGVTIRLLDVGGDKLTDRDSGEANPYLGWRGARLLLNQPGLLETQLDAILRVSGMYPGQIRIMLPMVTEIDEWYQFRSRYQAQCLRMQSSGIEIDESIPLGLMIEVPSAALMAAEFARESDFMSIGTNDLTQYVLAVDRGNPMVADMYDSLHPAVLECIRMTVQAGISHSKPVSVCGESAGRYISAACLIGLGVYELSMQMRNIPSIRGLITRHTLEEFRQLASDFMEATTREKRTAAIRKWTNSFGL
jgi:phosphotransferase system enzyme I (PtsI)